VMIGGIEDAMEGYDVVVGSEGEEVAWASGRRAGRRPRRGAQA
jgi:hypothetical protein